MNKLISLVFIMVTIAGCETTSKESLKPAVLAKSNAETVSVIKTAMKEHFNVPIKTLAPDVFSTSSWLTLERANNAVLGVVTEMPLKLRLMTDNQQNCYLSKQDEEKTVQLFQLSCKLESDNN
ncbi:hypothetical protein [Thalassotalea sediminis]|uniref:hypothetical protein n=1 Tax=Thalassotalea sediminis TaxID=1759089 RepID=UPI0025735F9E|nr:hypothetical protein [Thalassotalea sediminis]